MLENKLNAELLDRGTRPAKVTLAGRRLYETATGLLRNAEEMLEGVRGISRAKRSVVRLGCIDSLAAAVGPVLFKALSSTTQQVRLWSGITPSLTSQFINRQLDILITTLPHSPLAGVSHVPLFAEQYLLTMPADFDPQPFGSISDLARRLPLIRYSARSTIGEDIDAFLAKHGDHVERTCEFDTSDPLFSLVAAGIGFAITTPMCIWQSRHFAPKLRMVPLDSLRARGRPYATTTRSFYLTFREGELGMLPKEVETLIRIAMDGHIAADMASTLGLPKEAIVSLYPAVR